ncbi:MAG TPA: sigma-70 family RNA polymerase sigma factor [Solirubrobacterales bacterium]|nr:sigma-70 family RNA polymerase sigma factor [Solirubrobacterales bacterium]
MALAQRAKAGDEVAFATLLKRHRNLLAIHTADYFAPGLERSDLYAEALLGLHKAVRDFKPTAGSSFRSFASLTIHRQVITAVKTATRRKHGPLNEASSIHATLGADSETTLEEVLPDHRPSDPADLLVSREELTRFQHQVAAHLTDLERTVLIALAGGRSYEEVAADLGATNKRVDNAAQRARRKLTGFAGVDADERVEAQAARPEQKDNHGRRPSQRRPRRHRSGRVPLLPAAAPASPPKPPPTRKEGPHMSITDAIEAERSSVQEEIAALEAQLDDRRLVLADLDDLHAKASMLASAGRIAPAEPKARPKSEKPKPTAERAGTVAERVDGIVALLAEHPTDGLGAQDLRRELHLSANQFRELRPHLAGRVEMRGNARSRRYFPLGSAERPKPAPTEDRRAPAAPVRKLHARRDTDGVAAHNALRARIVTAIREVLEERATGRDQLTEKVLALVPGAEAQDVVSCRRKLLGDHQIEIRANKVQLTGVDRSQPITEVERQVVASLGSGRTAREVAANCSLVRDAFSARTICEAMATRGVIQRRPDSSPPVYEAPSATEAAA